MIDRLSRSAERLPVSRVKPPSIADHPPQCTAQSRHGGALVDWRGAGKKHKASACDCETLFGLVFGRIPQLFLRLLSETRLRALGVQRRLSGFFPMSTENTHFHMFWGDFYTVV